MVTEVVECGACKKAKEARGEGSEEKIQTRWMAWDDNILSQLSGAHQALFPAVLTAR